MTTTTDQTEHQAELAPEGTASLARRDLFSAYTAEIRRHPLLSREEEHALAVRWAEHGDRDAARRLVTCNLRLVLAIAQKYSRSICNSLDLVQEGGIGLVKAVERFDPSRDVKLSTYAAWWIRAHILKHILDNARLVRVGTSQHQRKLFFKLRQQQAALEAAGVDPSAENVARELDVPARVVLEMDLRLSARDQSLDAPLSSADGDGALTRLDMVADESPQGPVDDPDTAGFKTLIHAKVMEFGTQLVGREREVFASRLMSNTPVTLQSLGERWGVTRERARQVEEHMVGRLRRFLHFELGDALRP